MLRKCCAHCPGSVTRTGDPIREHVCNVPDYVSGNLRISSLKSNNNNNNICKKHPERSKSVGSNSTASKEEPIKSCYERFAVAKKFHAENLQHQPLPDRVDDAIFSQFGRAEQPCMCETVKRCQKIIPRRSQIRKKELNRVHKYTPVLGCKKPMTYMDLAICWETPVDPIYEPRRATHIDGSDGGPAPAVFALVSHEDSQVDVRDGCIPGQQENQQQEEEEEEEDDEVHDCHDKCQQTETDALCKHFDSIHISDMKSHAKAIGDEARGKRAQFMRHCIACDKNGSARKQNHRPRGIRSASCLQKQGCSVIAKKNNGLPNLTNRVPRPRTPYARRSFCIDTLTPPFSIVHGCRDADYPEHWRLTSVYQQSYRQPKKLREGRTLLTYDRRR